MERSLIVINLMTTKVLLSLVILLSLWKSITFNIKLMDFFLLRAYYIITPWWIHYNLTTVRAMCDHGKIEFYTMDSSYKIIIDRPPKQK